MLRNRSSPKMFCILILMLVFLAIPAMAPAMVTLEQFPVAGNVFAANDRTDMGMALCLMPTLPCADANTILALAILFDNDFAPQWANDIFITMITSHGKDVFAQFFNFNTDSAAFGPTAQFRADTTSVTTNVIAPTTIIAIGQFIGTPSEPAYHLRL